MVSKDLFNLLESYAVECGITYDEIIEVLKKSLAASAKKVEPNATIIVKVNPEKHEVVITAQRQVVEELSTEPSDDPNAIAEITLEDAKKIKPNCHVGDIISKNISTKDDLVAKRLEVLNQHLHQILKHYFVIKHSNILRAKKMK